MQVLKGAGLCLSREEIVIMRQSTVAARAVLAASCLALWAGPAFAAGSGMPWEAPLQQLVDSITGPVAQFAAVIAVVIFGLGVAFSENGSSMRRGVSVLFGLSIAFAASTFFVEWFGFAGGLTAP